MYLGGWKIDDVITFYANTTRFDTGAATDADSAPTYRIFEDETSTPILTGSMALLDSSNTAGFYSEQITLSAANGFEKGKSYAIYKQATVNGVTGATHDTLQIEPEVDANTVSGTVANVTTTTNLTNLPAITTDWLTAAGTAADFTTEIQAGLATAAALATAQTSIDDLPTNAELAIALAAADDAVLAAVSTRASQTSVDDVPTNAELAAALASADDAVLAAIAALNDPSALAIADAVLSRGVANVEDTADTTSLAAIILAILESSVSGDTWTIRKTDGSTFVTKTVTVDGTADPITGVT